MQKLPDSRSRGRIRSAVVRCRGGGPADGLGIQCEGMPPNTVTYRSGGHDHLYAVTITWRGAVYAYMGIISVRCEHPAPGGA